MEVWDELLQKEFIPHFHAVVGPLKPYRKAGADFEDLKQDPAAVQALRALRNAVATKTPLVNPDFDAAANYVYSERPFEIYADASDFGWSCVLAQRETIHGTTQPIAVAL